MSLKPWNSEMEIKHAILEMVSKHFSFGRQPVLQEMEVTADHWVRFKTGNIAVAKQPMPFKTTRQKPLTDFEDRFQDSKLKIDWTWNYPYSDVNIALKKGKLSLSGTPKKDNKQGTALCLRPQSSHYSCETKVIRANESLQGLTLYANFRPAISILNEKFLPLYGYGELYRQRPQISSRDLRIGRRTEAHQDRGRTGLYFQLLRK